MSDSCETEAEDAAVGELREDFADLAVPHERLTGDFHGERAGRKPPRMRPQAVNAQSKSRGITTDYGRNTDRTAPPPCLARASTDSGRAKAVRAESFSFSQILMSDW